MNFLLLFNMFLVFVVFYFTLMVAPKLMFRNYCYFVAQPAHVLLILEVCCLPQFEREPLEEGGGGQKRGLMLGRGRILGQVSRVFLQASDGASRCSVRNNLYAM